MAHLTIAASEQTFTVLFNALRDNFKLAESDSGSFGPLTASYAVEAHLEGGTVDLRADNTVQVKELDIKWDKLDLTLGIDIPEQSIGGFCIIPTPWGCALRAPKISIFEANPDILITLPLGDLITSEISVTGSLRTQYATNHPANVNPWTAQNAEPSQANYWQIFIDPESIDLDVFDIADIVGDLLDDALDAAVDDLLSFLPDWARDLIKTLFGSLIDLVRDLIDLTDDVEEWISDLLNVSLGLFNLVLQLIAEYISSKYPIQQIEDPYPILAAEENPNPPGPKLLPVKIPILDLKVFNTSQEMVLEGTVG